MEVEILNIKLIPLFISILALIGLINTIILILPVLKYTIRLFNYIRNQL
jgi:hypothetical protein